MQRSIALRITGAALALAAGFGLAVAGPASAAVPAAKDKTLIVRDLPAQVRLIPGEKVKVRLSTNVTTGYSFFAQGGKNAAGSAVVKVPAKGAYAAPTTPTGMVGAPGETTWTLTAVKPGKTTIDFVTRPPGVDNTMQDESLGVLTVIVAKS
jgi:predicted secreted protein